MWIKPTWIKLWDLAEYFSPKKQDQIWAHYQTTTLGGYQPPSKKFDVFSFAKTKESAAHLAHLVRMGNKRGTAFWVTETSHDHEQFFPFVGALSLVTDGFGFPLCFIATRSTRIHHLLIALVSSTGFAAPTGWADRTQECVERVNK